MEIENAIKKINEIIDNIRPEDFPSTASENPSFDDPPNDYTKLMELLRAALQILKNNQ